MEKTTEHDEREVSKEEGYVHLLLGLLHYHERIDLNSGNYCKSKINGRCANKVFNDEYANALREAIRCIKLVNHLTGS